MELIKAPRVSLRNHPELSEKWIHKQIADDPAILDLGDLELRDMERRQAQAGRLDLLLQDPEDRRYEVEIQLGPTDESHIIRTIEYWDIERKRYPQYDHCAVIVAEEITGRFLNVISLFNGSIPLIALRMNAFNVEGRILLVFTKVLDEVQRGLVDEDEGLAVKVDRSQWEKNKETLAITDRLFEVLHALDPSLTLTYNKFHIGLARNSQPDNFVVFKPKRSFLKLEPRLEETTEVTEKLTGAGLEMLPYQKKAGRYRIRVFPADLEKHMDTLKDVLGAAFKQDLVSVD